LDQPEQYLKKVKNEALQAPRGPDPEQFAHQQAQIAPGDMNQQTLENPSMSPQVGPTHAARLIAVSERPLQQFASFSQQPLAAIAPNPPAVGVHRLSFLWLALPATPAPVFRLRHIAANLLLLQIRERPANPVFFLRALGIMFADDA